MDVVTLAPTNWFERLESVQSYLERLDDEMVRIGVCLEVMREKDHRAMACDAPKMARINEVIDRSLVAEAFRRDVLIRLN